MATGWKNVHVFISSTFNDMHAERDYLVKRVFPQLRDWCEERKLRLVDIDLRWGVTEEDATRNCNVVRTCLERIDQCRPFFVCFLGQRRGWVPEPSHIAQDTLNAFPELARYVGNASVTEMEILHALIEPLHGGKRYVDSKEDEFYERVEHAFFYLREDFYLAALPPMLRATYTNERSEDPNGDNAELARWRDDVIPSETSKWNRPLHRYRAKWMPEANTPELAMPLQCPAADLGNQRRWRKAWRDAGLQLADDSLEVPSGEEAKAGAFNKQLTSGRLGSFQAETGEELADVMLLELQQAIEQRHPEHRPVEQEDLLQKEIDQHEEFVYTSNEGFIKRVGDFDVLDEYLADDSGQMFALTAPGGMGKSMLLANWAHTRRGEGRTVDTAFVCRFVGQSDRSSTVTGLLRFIMLELQQVHNRIPKTRMENFKNPDGQEEQREVPFEIPQDDTEVHNTWRDQLKHLGEHGKTVIVIDAINQLETGLENLYWLPFAGLPKNVKVIVSLREGAPGSEGCMERWTVIPNVRMSRAKPFDDLDDRRKLVEAYLSQFLKVLDKNHREALIRSEGAGNPLFLKVVLSELRVLGAFAQLGEVIRSQFGNTPESAFQAVLRRLESDPAYSAVAPSQAVPLIFGFITHTRRGLTAEELAELLQVNERNGTLPKKAALDTVHLVLRQVRPFQTRHGGRFDFFYESFKTIATERYVGNPDGPMPLKRPAEAWHSLIADYFHAQPNFVHCTITDLRRQPHKRRCEELVWQLAQAGERPRLIALLMSLEYLEAKVAAGMTFELPGDFAAVLRTVAAKHPEREVLVLLDRALRRDIHFIARHAEDYPQALFQCLWNSAWWYDCPETAYHYRQSCRRWSWSKRVPKLHEHLEQARASRECNNGVFLWVRSLQPPNLRLDTSQEAVFNGHASSVTGVAFSPDGRSLASGSTDRAVRLWDTHTGQERACLKGHTDHVSSVAFSPDGRTLASGSEDKTVRLWDTQTGQERACLKGHTDYVSSVAFSPDGHTLASGSQDKTVRLWDTQTDQERACLKGHTDYVSSLAFSPDGHTLASGSKDQTVRQWGAQTGLERTKPIRHFTRVSSVAFSPDGRTLASGLSAVVVLFDAETGRQRACLEGHTRYITGIAFSPDGRTLASGSHDKKVRLWDCETCRDSDSLEGHTASVTSVAFSPDGRILASGSGDDTVRLWNTQANHNRAWPNGHKAPVTSLVFSPDGRMVASASEDHTVRLWDTETGRERACLEGHTDCVDSLTFSPDGRTLASASYDKTICLWDTQRCRKWTCLKGHAEAVRAIAFSSDGRMLASGSIDNTVRLWDVQKGQEYACAHGHTDEVGCVIYSSDGHMLASGSHDCTVRLWDAQTGQELTRLLGHTDLVTCVAFSPDGRWLASASGFSFEAMQPQAGTVRLWDTYTGRERLFLQGHTRPVRSVAFSSNGRILAGDEGFYESSRRVARLWDVHTGKCLDSVQGQGDIGAIAAGPERHSFRALSRCGETVIEDAATGKPVAWFPEASTLITSHPTESVWALNLSGGCLGIIRLENFGGVQPKKRKSFVGKRRRFASGTRNWFGSIMKHPKLKAFAIVSASSTLSTLLVTISVTFSPWFWLITTPLIFFFVSRAISVLLVATKLVREVRCAHCGDRTLLWRGKSLYCPRCDL